MSLSVYVNNQYGLTISACRISGADRQKLLPRMSEPPRTAHPRHVGQAAVHLPFRVA
jgi:hypothetical protein